jgi:hypothetical protein
MNYSMIISFGIKIEVNYALGSALHANAVVAAWGKEALGIEGLMES